MTRRILIALASAALAAMLVVAADTPALVDTPTILSFLLAAILVVLITEGD